MTAKRPYASEGHLRLPPRPADEALGAPDTRSTRTVDVQGDELAAFDIRLGDRVVLVNRLEVEHGDIVARAGDEGALTLWKAYPDHERIRLKNATGQRELPCGASFDGVVVAVVRSFRS